MFVFSLAKEVYRSLIYKGVGFELGRMGLQGWAVPTKKY
jgi:hypothetical protein